jgi:hypothetical protein
MTTLPLHIAQERAQSAPRGRKTLAHVRLMDARTEALKSEIVRELPHLSLKGN